MKKKKSLKRNIIEWVIIIVVGGTLYLSGYHTEVIGRFQQIVLWTGIMTPDIELPLEEQMPADYNWQVISMDGEVVNLNDLEGKVLFINFWATWCPPCVAEMPNIHNLYKKVKSDSIVFLMISVDDDQQKVKDFINRKEYSFPVYRIGSHLPSVFSSRTLPTTFVVSPMGKIVSIKRGLAKYDTKEFRNFLEGMVKKTEKNLM
ncbi:MAG: TlpA family protein disulfide reductase [Calditrichia bacterium]|nr:TlpA family protein disulfide reductase [Calditrichia bacterium]